MPNGTCGGVRGGLVSTYSINLLLSIDFFMQEVYNVLVLLKILNQKRI